MKDQNDRTKANIKDSKIVSKITSQVKESNLTEYVKRKADSLRGCCK